MRRLDAGRALKDELEELRAEEPHGARRQAVGAVIVFRVVADRLEVRPEYERRAVDKEDVIALLDGAVGAVHGSSG